MKNPKQILKNIITWLQLQIKQLKQSKVSPLELEVIDNGSDSFFDSSLRTWSEEPDSTGIYTITTSRFIQIKKLRQLNKIKASLLAPKVIDNYHSFFDKTPPRTWSEESDSTGIYNITTSRPIIQLNKTKVSPLEPEVIDNSSDSSDGFVDRTLRTWSEKSVKGNGFTSEDNNNLLTSIDLEKLKVITVINPLPIVRRMSV